MAAGMGTFAQFGVDASSVTSTEKYEFTSLTMTFNDQLFNAEGIRGSRSQHSERTRQNTNAPRFTVTMQPNSVELDAWLPRILGAAEAADAFALAETVPTFVSNIDAVTKRYHFTGCKVARAVFRATQGGPLELTLDVEALSVAESATTFPTLSVSTIGPYMFASDTASGLSVGGSAYQFFDVQIEIDNVLDTGRFLNSATRVSLPERDRRIIWTWDGPHGDNSALFGLTASGVASSATFTNGNRSVVFASTTVSYPREFPTINGREEVRLPLVGQARAHSGTNLNEFAVTNDSSG